MNLPHSSGEGSAAVITRKIWKGDFLRISEGNAFQGDQVVHVNAGYAFVSADSEPCDPLVEIDGGAYIVKRCDLHELNEHECRVMKAGATIIYRGLNGATSEDIANAVETLTSNSEENL